MNPDPVVLPPADAVADAPPSPQQLARARWATRAQFAALGLLAGAWGVHIPSVKAHYQLDEFNLSLMLLAGGCGAVSMLFVAGRAIGRFGARRGAAMAGLAVCAALMLVLAWAGIVPLLLTMLLLGAGMSLFDVAINAEGTALESLGGRSVMSNLHAMFSVGGMAGAGLTSLLLRAGVAPLLQLLLVGSAVAVLIVVASRSMLEVHPRDDSLPQAHFAWPRGQLLVIGLLVFCGMTAEGVMYDWSVLYLEQQVLMSQAQAGLGYAAFAAAMAATRFAGDALRSRFAERRVLGFGAAVAATAMAIVLVSGHPLLSVVGFALVGAGLAPVVPILFSAATRVRGVSRAAAIASASSVGYVGFMVGPPLIGGIAHASSLTIALGVVVVAAALLAIGARRIP
ncbi:MFS transporter [Piscinibacter sakaiensis]|uniref:MFS transporter n=1 Tax=Piscinibacter sakaiensis TaxID=1547922 RepID=UPI003AADC6EF